MGRTVGRSATSKANVFCTRVTDDEAIMADAQAAALGLERGPWLRTLIEREIYDDGGE